MSANPGAFNCGTQHAWRSPEQVIASTATGIPCPIWDRAPDQMEVRLICKVTDLGWPVGAELEGRACLYDTVTAGYIQNITAAWSPGMACPNVQGNTGLYLNSASLFGPIAAMTTASWAFVVIFTWNRN